jgi:hypothetical protein
MVSKIVNGVSIELSEEEFAVISSQTPPIWVVEGEERRKRDRLLSVSDWRALSDSPAMTNEYATYRQELRDITNQDGFPYSVDWPIEPN